MIKVENLSFNYSERKILNDISFTANSGEMLAVLGPNGVGKSTLFRCILGLAKNYGGNIFVDGTPITEYTSAQLARKIAYLPQNHYPSFNYSVIDMVLMGTTSLVGGFSSPKEEHRRAAYNALKQVGVEHLSDRGYLQISGGERQLVLIARAIAQQAKLIVMDEPTTGLDYGNRHKVMLRIRELVKEGYTVIQSTHSPNQTFLFADRILAIKGGEVIGIGAPNDILNSELIDKLYGINVQIHQNDDGSHFCTPDVEIMQHVSEDIDDII